jgi:3'-phosphoadenosine 5'-phosphosulfate (PAPS) 3'-phosphatase
MVISIVKFELKIYEHWTWCIPPLEGTTAFTNRRQQS